MKSKGFATKETGTGKAKHAEPAPLRTYTRDAASDTWKDSHGKAYRLDQHGTTRLDLQPA